MKKERSNPPNRIQQEELPLLLENQRQKLGLVKFWACTMAFVSLAVFQSCASRETKDQVQTEVKNTAAVPQLPAREQKDALRNYNSSIVCKIGEYYTARSVSEIQAVVARVNAEKKTLRVVSHEVPHTYSQALCPADGGTILNVSPLNQISTVEIKGNKPFAVVQPGVLIPQLQKHLDPMGFTFPVTPDYNGVTFAGAMATGAHSSSLKIQAAVADWVEAITFVDGTGQVQTLEGDKLNKVRVHLGLIGVITSLKVRIVPQYKLSYGFERKEDKNLAEDIVSDVLKHDFARVRWFPKHKKYILDYFDKKENTTKGDSRDNAWTTVPDLSIFGDFSSKLLNANKAVTCAAELARIATFSGTFEKINSENGTIVGKSHEMIAGNCEQGKCPWNKGTKARTVEVAFPLSKIKNWIADVRSIIDAREACFPINGLYLRFSRASEATLAQASGADTIMFEIHIAATEKPSLEQGSEVYDEILQMTLAKYSGRPHWAKNSAPYFRGLGSAQFPQFEAFEEARKTFDPNGIMKSKLWENVLKAKNKKLFEANTERERPSECGVSRLCLCELGSKTDCGKDGKCVEGSFFKEARVCRPTIFGF